jgi:hypothetical protein
MYKTIANPLGGSPTIYRVSDQTSFGCDLDNTDYQAYLKFLEEGGVPEPAEVTE